MKKIRKISIVILVSLFTISFFAVNAQDVRFSQPLNNPLLLNPSMMGMDNSIRALLTSRSQWSSIDNGFKTASFSFIMPVFLNEEEWNSKEGKRRLDFGINTTGEKAGAFTFLNASLSVGYGLFVSENNFLHTSINVGYLQNSLNSNDLIFDDQFQWGSFNPAVTSAEAIPNYKTSALDVGFGFLWYYKNEDGKFNAFAGLSGFHLNQPDLSYTSQRSTLPSRFSFQTGLQIRGENDLNLNPSFIYSTQGDHNQVLAGLSVDYKGMKLGSWYKYNESIVLLAGYTHEKFRFNYSYDFGASVISRNIYGLTTHEISLAYNISTKY